MAFVGNLLRTGHALLTTPQHTAQGFCNVVKYGTICRTVIWPCLPPIMLYQYIRQKDRDMWATELLYAKSETDDTKAFFNKDKKGLTGHWRIQMDIDDIRKAANQE